MVVIPGKSRDPGGPPVGPGGALAAGNPGMALAVGSVLRVSGPAPAQTITGHRFISSRYWQLG